MDLTAHILDAVDRYWADDVKILGAWPDGPTGAFVVYRRTIDPTLTLGHWFGFDARAADGTIEGFARDIAINLAEPIGAAAGNSRLDDHGIFWVAHRKDTPTPQPPAEVLERLRTWKTI